MRSASPLRYPGGKWRLANFFSRLIRLNGLHDVHYFEPYAGGASLALTLLFQGFVGEVHLNDLDPAIYAVWRAILDHPSAFARRIGQIEITPSEWVKQKKIYAYGVKAGTFDLGFATFFLNRTNHSGILNAGMIGGNKQEGRWKLDARFNRADLQTRVLRVAKFRNRIHLTKLDAAEFLHRERFSRRMLVYLDPPYYVPGRHLYLNAYTHADHTVIRRSLDQLTCHWVVSYDDVRPIRKLYRGIQSRRHELLHTARTARLGSEVLFFSDDLRIPAR